MRPRQTRSYERVTLANWEKDENQRKFIANLLIKQGVPLAKNVCPSMMENGARCILKDFKRMGSGGVGLAWACVLCRNGEDIIDGLPEQAVLQGKLGSFSGSCRYSTSSGDANKLVILPSYTSKKIPRILKAERQSIITPKGVMERIAFRVLTRS